MLSFFLRTSFGTSPQKYSHLPALGPSLLRLLSHTKHIFQNASVCWPTAFHFAAPTSFCRPSPITPALVGHYVKMSVLSCRVLNAGEVGVGGGDEVANAIT